MFVFNILLYVFALFGLFCLIYLVLLGVEPNRHDTHDAPRMKKHLPSRWYRPTPAGWGFEPVPKGEDEPMCRTLFATPNTIRLLEELHKIEYDLLAEGSHDAFRDDRQALLPKEDAGAKPNLAKHCLRVFRSINYIRSKSGTAPLEIMADFDAMLQRIIQRHRDDFNYPPVNFLR